MKNAVELTESLRYKLRMFGVPIEVATNVFCDNEIKALTKALTQSESAETSSGRGVKIVI